MTLPIPIEPTPWPEEHTLEDLFAHGSPHSGFVLVHADTIEGKRLRLRVPVTIAMACALRLFESARATLGWHEPMTEEPPSWRGPRDLRVISGGRR